MEEHRSQALTIIVKYDILSTIIPLLMKYWYNTRVIVNNVDRKLVTALWTELYC